MKYPYVRRLPRFEYLSPKTVDEAIHLLSRHGREAKPIAGGTDIVLKMKRREEVPRYLIGLKNIHGLDTIEHNDGQGLRFGPLVTIHDMETSAVVRGNYPILSHAASTIGSAQIRNLGTVVGNLCNALPSADMIPSLIVLGATVTIAGREGKRIVAVEDFLTGPGKTVLSHDEIVTEVQVPVFPPQAGAAYIKHATREAMDLAIISVAALITLDEGRCSEAKICLGTAGPTQVRARKAEGILRGKPWSAELVTEASEMASGEVQPRSSIRASAEYRKEMARILTARALNQAREEIAEQGSPEKLNA
jgi:carbon-monoxide dehydrogenase medium subunit